MWVQFLVRSVSVLAVVSVGMVLFVHHASAATITVNSADDLAADDGICTLREAITAANSDTVSGASGGECAAGSGSDTVNFAMTTGGSTFTNDGQTGYTISLGTVLPGLTTTMTINGYSQPGSLANTNPAPQALNGRLLVEIEGSSIVADTYAFDMQADNIAVRGLVVSGFDVSGAFGIGANNLEIQGNYVGTNYQGTAAATNQLGFGVARSGGGSVSGLLVGGLDPEDRNLFGGMLQSAITPNSNSHNWTIQGNYVGVDITGLSAIPNVTASTAGSLSLDNSNGHLVGGTEPTAINVISGNHGKGIAPNGTNSTRIEGNYIGVGRDGVTPLGNQAGGISYSGGNNDILIKDNIISHNADVGIYLADDPLSVVVQGNTIMHNYYQGILIADASLILIGGDTAQERNVISNNNLAGLSNMANISLVGLNATVSNVGIRGNYIGINESGAIDPSFNASTLGIGVALMAEDIMIGGGSARRR